VSRWKLVDFQTLIRLAIVHQACFTEDAAHLATDAGAERLTVDWVNSPFGASGRVAFVRRLERIWRNAVGRNTIVHLASWTAFSNLLMMKTTEEVIAVDWNNVVRIVVATLVLEAFTEVLAIMVLMRVFARELAIHGLVDLVAGIANEVPHLAVQALLVAITVHPRLRTFHTVIVCECNTCKCKNHETL